MIMRLLCTTVFLTVWCICCSIVPAFAEAPTESYSLDQITVTATSDPVADLRNPSTIYVITKERIEETGAANAQEALKYVPGFNIQTWTPTGNTTVAFRGVGSDNVLVLVDGVPINQQGQNNLDTILASQIEKIEVVKGGSAILYGAGGAGAVVNVITKKQMANTVRVGFGDTNKKIGEIGWQFGKLGLFYNYDSQKEMGKYAYAPGAYYTLDKSDKTNVGLKYKFDNSWSMEYLYTSKENTYSDRQQAKNWQKVNVTDSNIAYHYGQIRYQNNNADLIVYGRARSWNSDGQNILTGVRSTGVRNTGSNYGFTFQNKWKIGGSDLTAGLAGEQEHYDYSNGGVSFNSDQRDSAAAFFLFKHPVSDRTTLYIGGREQYYEKSGSAFCPQFQVLHSMGKNQSLYLNANKSFRVPTFLELYGTTTTALYNPDLKPETGWTYELGYKRQFNNNSSFKTGLFFMDISDRIYSEKQGLYTMRKNAAKYQNAGIEATFEQKLSPKWKYTLSASYSNPLQKDANTTTGVLSDWKQVNNRFHIIGGLGYNTGKLSMNVNVSYVADRKTDASVPIGALVDATFAAKYQINSRERLNFVIYNLFNRDDEISNSGGYLLGRTWRLDYQISF